jgi:hypothetical protein
MPAPADQGSSTSSDGELEGAAPPVCAKCRTETFASAHFCIRCGNPLRASQHPPRSVSSVWQRERLPSTPEIDGVYGMVSADASPRQQSRVAAPDVPDTRGRRPR